MSQGGRRYPKSVEGALLKALPELANTIYNDELTITIPDEIILPRAKTEKIFQRMTVMTDRNKRKNLDNPEEEDKDAVDDLDRFEYRPSNYYKDL